ncbi:MAG: M23 family metallopeptidase [Chitinophagaceae bacterium]|nr:MAG: M23 family metallopeptidase [Chitinophagaceae bacterium]
MAGKKYWKRLIKMLILTLATIAAGTYLFTLLGSSVTQYSHDYIYELPFAKGSSYKIVQGYGGLFSHQHAAALDFNMPVGTAVYAAREGMLYSYKDESDEGGPFAIYKRKANYIMIRHSDGSFGCYWHLKKDGVVIKQGAVKKGELIGYSGATGFTLRPHLHFSVKRVLSYEKDAFVKTKFRTGHGIEQLENKGVYTRPY